MTEQTRAVFWKRFWWLGVILGIGSLISLFASINSSHVKTASPLDDDKVITASPVHADQIYSVSKYRSCAGHEYSGTDFNGESEPSSSMKAYFAPIRSLSNSRDKVIVYAPFDGKIVRIDQMDISRGRQFTIEHDPFNGWYVVFMHININDKVKEGARVKSGEMLGYADTVNGADFDVILQRFKKRPDFGIDEFSNLEPIFSHMTDSVLQQFTARGLVVNDTIIPKAYRISNPCPCAIRTETGFCYQYAMGTEDDWVVINNDSSEMPEPLRKISEIEEQWMKEESPPSLEEAFNASPPTKRYLLAFVICDPTETDCNDPRNHRIGLAQSDDGAEWSEVPGWMPVRGSVPDIIRRNDSLYLFGAGVWRYRFSTGRWEPSALAVERSDGGEEMAGDISPILDDRGRIVLFYLGNDLTECKGKPCMKYIRSATEVDGSDGTRFLKDPGDRFDTPLKETAGTDPDIFRGPSGYILFISWGDDIQALSSLELRGTYTNIGGLSNGQLSLDLGGVPAGHYDSATGQYWTYINRGGRSPGIGRVVHPRIDAPLTGSQVSTVLSGSDFPGLRSTTGVGSPGFAVNAEGRLEPQRMGAVSIPSSIEESCVGFKISSPNRTATINLIGAGWATLMGPHFTWGRIEKEPGMFDFSEMDDVVRTAQENNVALLAEMQPFADWDQAWDESCRAKEREYLCKPKDMEAYKRFVSKTVERYDGDGQDDMPGLSIPVRYWQIINEPDIKDDPHVIFFVGSGKDYVEVLKESYLTIKQACPDCKVLHGAAAGLRSDMLSFWDEVFRYNGDDYFDIANIHYVGIDAATGQTVGLGDLSTMNVGPFKNYLEGHDIDKPIWVTEAVLESSSARSSLRGALSAGASKVFFLGFGVEEPAPVGEYSAEFKGVTELCPAS